MMHDVVIDELETHLSGGPASRNASRAFYAHLDVCADCRAEVAEMDQLSTLLREFRFDPENADADDTVVQASLGFYNRVRYSIVEKRQKEAWGIFTPEAAFFRRIVFASLLLIAGFGSYLVSRESPVKGTDAAAIMAQHDPVATHSDSSDRDRMLVTLATWHE